MYSGTPKDFNSIEQDCLRVSPLFLHAWRAGHPNMSFPNLFDVELPMGRSRASAYNPLW